MKYIAILFGAVVKTPIGALVREIAAALKGAPRNDISTIVFASVAKQSRNVGSAVDKTPIGALVREIATALENAPRNDGGTITS